MSQIGLKVKYDDVIRTMRLSGLFRVTATGAIETTYQWRGTREFDMPWYRCDRLDGKGYLYVSFRCARVKAHRLAYALYWDADLHGLEINHINGDRLDNTCSNLELCTASRQSTHAYDTGLNKARGEKHPRAKFKEGDIRKIRGLRALGVPIKTLASRYNVVPLTIKLVCSRFTWRHVK